MAMRKCSATGSSRESLSSATGRSARSNASHSMHPFFQRTRPPAGNISPAPSGLRSQHARRVSRGGIATPLGL
ncbi:hypothetical protein B5F44_14340 [Gordonibacter urolithinfaciens]|nr:hypothetical protein B5F44_14340 [Gordonibacter urolithinfaciens]